MLAKHLLEGKWQKIVAFWGGFYASFSLSTFSQLGLYDYSYGFVDEESMI
jgi:hypothetical protein